jgi:hypothetical protein
VLRCLRDEREGVGPSIGCDWRGQALRLCAGLQGSRRVADYLGHWMASVRPPMLLGHLRTFFAQGRTGRPGKMTDRLFALGSGNRFLHVASRCSLLFGARHKYPRTDVAILFASPLPVAYRPRAHTAVSDRYRHARSVQGNPPD